MKRNVQILLLFACLAPLLAQAGEETMEERKRRIMRKYLRERLDITYSDEVVPGDDDEPDDVLESEKFKEPEVDLKRQDPGVMMSPPMRPPAPRTENRNWLLSDPEDQDDPYTDPFSRKDAKAETKKDDWTAQGIGQEPTPYFDTQRESRVSWGEYDSSSREQSGSYDSAKQGGVYNPRSTFYGEGQQKGFQQQEGQFFRSSEGQDQSYGSAYNRTFYQNQTQTLFPKEAETPADPIFNPEQQPGIGSYTPYKSPFQTQRDQRQEQWGSYTPYKSTYQTQREKRRQQWGGSGMPMQEYQRKDSFQQWKKRNPAQLDPMSADAYIKETMPKPRR